MHQLKQYKDIKLNTGKSAQVGLELVFKGINSIHSP